MKLSFPFGNKNRKVRNARKFDPDEVILGLDVGTRYIKAVLFKVQSSSEIKIIGYARIAQKYGAMRDAMIINLGQVIEACDICVGKALDYAEKKYGTLPLPVKSVIGIAGELVRGVSIIANYQRDNAGSKINEVELESVVAQVKEDSFSGALEEISAEIGVESEQIQEISSRIDTTTIDGMVVSSPLGFTGKNVQYRVYSTFAPKLHINSLFELANSLGLDDTTIVVQPYAIARSMEESKDPKKGAILIDIGGGTTDIGLMSNGSVLGTKMFAFGGDVITKRIAEKFKLDMPEAEEMKMDYSDGNLGEVQTKEIKSLIAQDLQIWVEGVQIALEELLDDEEGDLANFPPQIYICGGGSALPEVREVLLSHPWLTVLPFTKFPKVTYLYPNQLKGIEDETKLLIDPSDVTPSAIARMLIDAG